MSDNEEIYLKIKEVAEHCGVLAEELADALRVCCNPSKKAIKELKKYGIDIDV